MKETLLEKAGWLERSLDKGTLLQVGAAVVINDHDQVLLARRTEGSSLGHQWEFPGGKLEDAEDAATCVKRELLEELRLQSHDVAPLFRVDHDYGRFQVRLYAVICTTSDTARKSLKLLDHDQAIWVSISEANHLELAAADRKLLRRLEALENPFPPRWRALDIAGNLGENP